MIARVVEFADDAFEDSFFSQVSTETTVPRGLIIEAFLERTRWRNAARMTSSCMIVARKMRFP